MPKISTFKTFWTILTQWEYWPFSIFYFPVFPYYAWLSLKCRSLFFFTASNPNIDFGGMMGEKKSEIFDQIPEKYLPKTILIAKGDQENAVQVASEIGYPIIAKPDIGERGTWVKKLKNEKELKAYVTSCPVNFLLQELVNFPAELGVFYVKYPNQKGQVTSIVRKEFLSVTGDGVSTVNDLLKKNQRALLTADLASDYLQQIGETVPSNGEQILVEPIGNHCKGTKFLNDNHEIDEALNVAFNAIADEIPDFYFGRFDLRCASYEDLRKLKNFKILELNGAGAEPGHVYQPGTSLLKAYGDIFWHLRVLAEISALNKKRGFSYWSFKQGYQKWKDHQRYNRLLSYS
jgi:hypothetical protein